MEQGQVEELLALLTPREFPPPPKASYNAIFGPHPKVGDTVYVDYGDSVLALPEFTGVVEAVMNGELLVSGRTIHLSYVAHVQVVQEGP